MTMRTGRCVRCGKLGDLAILCWNVSDYAGYCVKCARDIRREQYAGFGMKMADPEAYEEATKGFDEPRVPVLYHDSNGWLQFFVPRGWLRCRS